jgi:hypothetical protein
LCSHEQQLPANIKLVKLMTYIKCNAIGPYGCLFVLIVFGLKNNAYLSNQLNHVHT